MPPGLSLSVCRPSICPSSDNLWSPVLLSSWYNLEDWVKMTLQALRRVILFFFLVEAGELELIQIRSYYQNTPCEFWLIWVKPRKPFMRWPILLKHLVFLRACYDVMRFNQWEDCRQISVSKFWFQMTCHSQLEFGNWVRYKQREKERRTTLHFLVVLTLNKIKYYT